MGDACPVVGCDGDDAHVNSAPKSTSGSRCLLEKSRVLYSGCPSPEVQQCGRPIESTLKRGIDFCSRFARGTV